MIAHQLRRVSQTPAAFTNWAQLLRDMATGRVGRGPETLTFRTRSGQQISCPNQPGARVPIYEVYAENCYELDWFLAGYLHRPINVIDIGAHVGAFACQLADLNHEATIVCFEPSTSTAAFLRQNAAQNRLADRVSVDERAIAAEAGWANFSDNGAGSALNGLVPAAPDGSHANDVETTSFDDIVTAIGAPVEVVKIDCEGGEYAAVLGSSPESWSTVRRVVLEYHPSNQHDWAELRTWFSDRGLEVVKDEPTDSHQGTAWLSRAGD